MVAEPLRNSASAGEEPGAEQARPGGARALETFWRLVVATVSSCLRYRVTGLAAEAAFFAVLSVPPLVFGLAGGIGYVANQFDPSQVDQMRDAVLDSSGRLLTERAVDKVIAPTLNDVLKGGRFDVISLGFVLALWSGSRALNVFIDTITVMHGFGGHRGIIRTRALSFVLYILALVTGIAAIPLMLAGPRLVDDALPGRLDFLLGFYWPVVGVICICFLATLYHVSVPVRTRWRFNLPGAVFSLVAWIVGSYLLRWILTATATDSRSIYGPLAAPIAVLLWLYLVAIAVLIGAAVNASFVKIFVDERRGTTLSAVSEQSVDPWSQGSTGRGQVSLPERVRSPWWALGQRLLAALAILVGTVCLVYFDRHAYYDNNDPTRQVSLVDAIYYTTVTLSTTGYGDIAPYKDGARLINAFVITPLRIAFLVLLIGTTLEVLASQGREMFRISRWRKAMGHHVVVVGYGTKGRSAVETLVSNGQDRESIVVVDPGQRPR